jgi:hypothetical protein
MSKLKFLWILIMLSYLSSVIALEADSTNASSQQPLLLPSQYNASYALGLYDGGHLNVRGKMVSGFILGTTLNLIGVAIVSSSYGKIEPAKIPAKVDQTSYTRGFKETASLKSKDAGLRGANAAATLELTAIAVWFMIALLEAQADQ